MFKIEIYVVPFITDTAQIKTCGAIITQYFYLIIYMYLVFLFTGAVLWGGNHVDHARAQEQSWSKILEFFRSKLNVTTITITGKL